MATMEIFKPFFEPSSLLIIGASRNEYTFNGIVLKNLLEARYKAKITIVHPHTKSIMGIPTLNSLEKVKALETKPDLAIILTRHDIYDILETLGKLKISHVLLQTDISYITTEQTYGEMEAKIKEIISKYDMYVLGPSMIGIIDFISGFTSSVIPTRSHILHLHQKNKIVSGVSFLAQSGGLSGACGWWNMPQPIPFSKVLHIGGQIQISEAEMLEYLFKDPKTKIISLYLKEISTEFISVMNKYKKHKPVLVKFVGKDTLSLEKLEQAGAITVANYIELFEYAKVFMWVPPPQNRNVAIIGPSSGAINLLIAEMRLHNIHLASLQSENRDFILNKIGGSTCELGNPVDYWPPKEFIGTQVCQVYYNASNSLMKDPNVGTLFLALEFFSEIEFDFSVFESIKQKFPNKPIIAILIQAEKEGADRVIAIGNELNIPVFRNEVERGVRALQVLLDYYLNND